MQIKFYITNKRLRKTVDRINGNNDKNCTYLRLHLILEMRNLNNIISLILEELTFMFKLLPPLYLQLNPTKSSLYGILTTYILEWNKIRKSNIENFRKSVKMRGRSCITFFIYFKFSKSTISFLYIIYIYNKKKRNFSILQ